jgi:hypothetical protein
VQQEEKELEGGKCSLNAPDDRGVLFIKNPLLLLIGLLATPDDLFRRFISRSITDIEFVERFPGLHIRAAFKPAGDPLQPPFAIVCRPTEFKDHFQGIVRKAAAAIAFILIDDIHETVEKTIEVFLAFPRDQDHPPQQREFVDVYLLS